MVASEVQSSGVLSDPLTLKNLDDSEEDLQIYENPAKFLFSISKLTDGLFLCGACALRADTFEKLGITCVINCTTREELPDPPLSSDITYLRISVRDSTITDLQQYFHTATDTINKVNLNGGKVLVHCIAGVSRSVSICLAYLLKYRDMSLKEAYAYIERRRPCIKPNNSFFKQLIEFEIKVRGIPSISMIFSNAIQSYIPDIYECEYTDRLCCQLKLCQRRHCGTH